MSYYPEDGSTKVYVQDNGDPNGEIWVVEEKADYIQTVIIPKADRAAVALALLGGITEEMVERCARTIGQFFDPAGLTWEQLPDGTRNAWRDASRRGLREVFGGGGE